MNKSRLLTGLLCSAVINVPVHAEENGQEEILELQPVEVTGQKITRTQMETVSSVRVIDDEELATSTRADNLYDIVDMTPNVTNTGGFNSLSIRGIANSGPTAVNNGAGTIGIFIDNALLTARGVQDNALTTWDLGSVEILRGPQSTTTGRNSLAGQIILRTKDPEFKSNGKAKLLLGDYGTMQTAIMQTGPITDQLAYRFTADFQRSDGYVTNDILNDRDFNQNKNKNFRLKLLYVLENDGELLLNLSHNNFRENGDNTVDSRQSGRSSRLNFPSRWKTKADSVSLTYTQPINDALTFESNTGYVRSKFTRTSDFDGSSETPFNNALGIPIPTDTAVLDQNTKEYNFNQEFLMRYNNDRIRSVAGFYYAQGKLDDGYTSNNVFIDFGGLPLLLKDTTDPDEEFRTYALFGDIDFKVTDKFTLMAGLRANKEQRKSSVTSDTQRAISYGPGLDFFIDGQLAALDLDGSSQSSEQSSFVLLPKLGFNYMWTDTLSTGFVVQKGYRPGGVSVNPIRGTAEKFDDESTLNYEASLRTIINKRLSINANVFYTDWKDQQVGVASENAISPLDFEIKNAGKSHLYGFEVESNLAVNSNWNLSAGIGYSKTEFDEFSVNGNDYSGQEYQFSRNWTGNMSSTYKFNNGWFAHGNISYASTGAANTTTPDTELDPFTLVNVKVGYEQDKWGVYLYANNLLDDKYRTQRVNNFTYGNATYGDPRVVGLVSTVSW